MKYLLDESGLSIVWERITALLANKVNDTPITAEEISELCGASILQAEEVSF